MVRMVSIVIVTFNSERVIDACLASLFSNTVDPDWEAVLLDNASGDGTVSAIQRFLDSRSREERGRVALVRSESNLGFAGGCNRAAGLSGGDVLIFLNPDTLLGKDWSSPLSRRLREDPSVGVIGPKILFPDGMTIQSAGGRVFENGFTEHHGYGEPDDGRWDEERDVDYAPGACLGIRRDLFEKCRGFDEGYYPAYFEETDLCAKARKLGYRVLYLPSSRVFHLGGHSTGNLSYNYFYWYHRHRLRYVLKNRPASRIVFGVLPREAQWFFRLLRWWLAGHAKRIFRGGSFPSGATERNYERGFPAVCKAYAVTLATFPAVLYARRFRNPAG